MQVVWNYCKGKMICEPDEPRDDHDNVDNDEPKRGHGGCGAAQPQIRKEGLKLFLQYKKGKDEDDVRITLLTLRFSLRPVLIWYYRTARRSSRANACSRRRRCTLPSARSRITTSRRLD